MQAQHLAAAAAAAMWLSAEWGVAHHHRRVLHYAHPRLSCQHDVCHMLSAGSPLQVTSGHQRSAGQQQCAGAETTWLLLGNFNALH
jgi:hypothetical protein